METKPQLHMTNQSIAKINPVTICKTIAITNQIVSFPISDIQIEDWYKTIARIRPQTTPDELQLVMDKFLDGRSKWDHRESLPNIIRGLNLLTLNKGEYLDTEKGMKYRVFGSDQSNFKRIYENDREF